MEHKDAKQGGWSWLGFFFNIFYYVGYNNFKKGTIFLIIGVIVNVIARLFGANIITILLGLGVAIYAGFNAKKDLPIKEIPFSWLKVIAILFVYMAMIAIIMTMIVQSAQN